jgi:quinol monooxygenase YgiN
MYIIHMHARKGEKIMTVQMLIRYPVSDYQQWRNVYESTVQHHQKLGVKPLHLFTDIENPNTVTLIFEAKDLECAKNYNASPELREAREKAGLLSKPEIHFLSSI